MNQTLLYLLDNDNQEAFSSLIRSFFAGIIRFLYSWISKFVDVMYSIASKDLGMGGYVESIADKIFIALIIFMIFKLTISIMTYLVDPDSFTDGGKGVQSIIKRVIISLILLISINPIFSILFDIQDIIIKDDIITNLVMGESNDSIYVTSEGNRAYLTQISPLCDEFEDPNARVISFSQGDHLALLTLRPFIQPITDSTDYKDRIKMLEEEKYCGINVDEMAYIDSSSEAFSSSMPGPHTAGYYMQWNIYNGYTGGWSVKNNLYLIDFNYIFALIIGIVVCLILISFCFDVVIRSFTLMILQVMAPIPIISYISPKGKSSEMLGIWVKKLMSTWLSLFIKMLALSLALTAIAAICESLSNDDSGFLMQIIIILGALMFAKKLPQLLEELIPGLKMSGGLELNPFKRIRKDALGGELLMNATGRGIGSITGAAGGALAGAKAGKEIGALGKGIALGALSGASTGFRNKKMSFGKGMEESYKNLTGNEFKRMTPVSLLMPKMGEQPVKETKDYIKKAYEQLNNKNSDLNISENISSELASDLMAKGYDIKDIKGMKNEAQSRINEKRTSIDELKAKTAGIESEKNNAKNLYDSYQTQYSNAIGNQNAIQTEYDNCKNNIANLDSEILKQEQSIGKGIGSFDVIARDNLEKLKNQRKMLENNLNTYTEQLNNANSAIQSIKTEMDKAEIDMNNKVEAYDNHIQQIDRTEAQLTSYKVDIENIEKYQRNRENETKIRSDISAINKDIDTFKKEKAQRERFYRVDPAPQQDYGSAKSNVDRRG